MPGGFPTRSEAEKAVDEAIAFLEREVHLFRTALCKDGGINPMAVLEYLKSVEAYEITSDLPIPEAEKLAEEAKGLIYALAAQGIAAGVKGESSVPHNKHNTRRKPRSRL